MIALILALSIIGNSILPIGNTYAGYSRWYRPGLMKVVSLNRGLEPVSCMVASPYERIGTWLKIENKKGDYRWCRVTDISHPKDRARHIRLNIVAEFDYNSARVLCGLNKEKKPNNCRVRVTRA